MSDLHAAAERVVATFTERDITLATAESLTGGLIGATITGVPGASKVFLGGVIAYDSAIKAGVLGVDPADIAVHTVISAEVADQMASGVKDLTDADWAVAVTGVAGPDPQEGHAPGEVWITVIGPRFGALPAPKQSRRFQFEGDRRSIREATVNAALDMLIQVISPVQVRSRV